MSKYYRKIERFFAPGEIIFSENNPCDGMYIIDSGRVRVFKKIDTPEGSKELELVQLGARSLFGEMALIDDQKRSATVQAIADTKCTVITKEMFKHQLDKLPSWVTSLIQVLVVRLRETNEKLRTKAQMFYDDTGSMVYVDEKEQTHARDVKLQLEAAIKQAHKTISSIGTHIEKNPVD